MKVVALSSALASIMICVQPASAINCYSIKVENESSAPIYVQWTAYGCLKFKHRHLKHICSEHSISPGSSRKFDYQWLTTQPNVLISFSGKDIGEEDPSLQDLKSVTYYVIRDGKVEKDDGLHGKGESAPHCDKHYTFSYTQDDLETDWARARKDRDLTSSSGD